MNRFTKHIRNLTTGFMLVLIAGCGTTATKESHPLLANPSDGNMAKVYFLRPDAVFMGVKGNAFKISLAEQELLSIAKGEYTLIYLKRYSGDVTVKSTTVEIRSGQNTQVTVKDSRPFTFDESMTYYITFKDSPRGYFPYAISEGAARSLASELKPMGNAIASPL